METRKNKGVDYSLVARHLIYYLQTPHAEHIIAGKASWLGARDIDELVSYITMFGISHPTAQQRAGVSD